MTVNETKNRIEAELAEIAASFGKAQDHVKYDVQIGENEIENGPTDITYVMGSLIICNEGSTEDEKLYLPLDAELDDDDNVNEENFNNNLEAFKEKVAPIRDRLASADDVDGEVSAIIAEFDRDIEEKYQAEIERLNKVAKRNLMMAAFGALGIAIIAVGILLIDKLL